MPGSEGYRHSAGRDFGGCMGSKNVRLEAICQRIGQRISSVQ